jgi:hypothetical protein
MQGIPNCGQENIHSITGTKFETHKANKRFETIPFYIGKYTNPRTEFKVLSVQTRDVLEIVDIKTQVLRDA